MSMRTQLHWYTQTICLVSTEILLETSVCLQRKTITQIKQNNKNNLVTQLYS